MALLLLECAIRAALVTAGTAVVLWTLRIRRAAVRHAAWAAVVVAMLALPLWAAGGPKLSLRVLRASSAAVPVVATIAAPVLTPPPSTTSDPAFDATWPSAATSQSARPGWTDILLGLYALGAVLLLVRLIVGTIYAHRLRRSARLREGRATSDRCVVPITVGWLSPMLVMPNGWQTWPAEKLSVVMTHEREHARRRDPLVQWVALLNRAVFWFHPLAWWLERRLATLAEESCDAVVLAAGHSAETYSECLLDLARTVASRGQRIRAVGMAMPGRGLNERMRLILDDACATAPMSRVRLVCTAALCAASTALFAGGTLTPRTPSSINVSPLTAQQPAGASPKFDVVSVKPCDPMTMPPAGRRGGRGAGAGGGNSDTISPGRVALECDTLVSLIDTAYAEFAEGHPHPPWSLPVLDRNTAPDWTNSDPFTVEATADPATPIAVMRGPMLQRALEDRFKLRIHRETRQVPVYEVVVAKGGSKLTPFKPGTCVPHDYTVFVQPALDPGQHQCWNGMRVHDDGGPVWDYSYEGLTLDEAFAFFRGFDRPLVNRTGIVGLVTFQLTYKGQENDPAALAAVIKDQLGLEVRPSKGPREFLVLDHAEHPTPNDAPASEAPVVQTAAAPRFDVVSVKPCEIPAPGGAGGRAGGGGGSGAESSPGSLRLPCSSLAYRIRVAYVEYANGRLNMPGVEPIFPRHILLPPSFS